MKNLILVFALSIHCFGLVACSEFASHGPDESSSGTSDGGGGGIATSSRAEVQAAIFEVRATLKKEGMIPWIAGVSEVKVANRILSEQVTDAFIAIGNPRKGVLTKAIENKTLSVEEKAKKITETKAMPEKIEDYIDGIELDFRESGPCPATGRNEADASVSSFDLRAKICFSMENLQRIPPVDLSLHIAGLWMHELAHMQGFGERVAALVQQMTESAYPRLTSATTLNLIYKLGSSLSWAGTGLYRASNAQLYAEPEQICDYINFQLGYVNGFLYSFLNIVDERRSIGSLFGPGHEVEKASIVSQTEKLINDLKTLSWADCQTLTSEETKKSFEMFGEESERINKQLQTLD